MARPDGEGGHGWRLLGAGGRDGVRVLGAAGPLISDGEPSAVLLAGWRCARPTGMLVNLADTPANRKAFGCTGTAAEDGEAAAPSRSCGSWR